jgi:methanogenic corrinoid protein MtbC1
MGKIFTRYGDGTPVELSEKEFMEDLVARAQMTKGMRIQEAKDYVAGAPVTPRWAARIGADGYAEDAQDGIVKIKEMLN